ncbi:MAG: FHA domain-containing protein [Armatimonadota bacterium]
MDVLEKWNRRFADWYEQLFADRDGALRPRDILRRLIDELESLRREGLDGDTYVPNRVVATVAVRDEAERDFLRAFVDGRELGDLVLEALSTHGYRTRGPMAITVAEAPYEPGRPRLSFECRFEAGPDDPAAPARPLDTAFDPDSDPGTVVAPPRPVALLAIVHSDGRRESVPVGPRGVRIGRGRTVGNDVVLADDPQVSKRHARLIWDGAQLSVEDAGSTNGTVVDGVPVRPETRVPLRDGAVLELGSTRLVATRTAEAPPAPSPPRPVANWMLVAADGRAWRITDRAMIGRGVLDDLRIEGEGVAAQHARLTLDGGVLRIEDLDAPGGTRVNGRRVPPRLPVALGDHDVVELGAVSLRVASEQHP